MVFRITNTLVLFLRKCVKVRMLLAFAMLILIVSQLFSTESFPVNSVSAASTEWAPKRTFYVSPGGSDTNPGTQASPWKSLYHASTRLQPGDLAIFLEGTYYETRQTVFNAGGTALNQIAVKAQNKGKATIYYQGRANQAKIDIRVPYVTIQDFVITQDSAGTGGNLNDGFVQCWQGADYCKVLGNNISNTVGICARSVGTTGVVFNGNVCNAGHGWGAFSSFGTFGMTISNNEVYNVGEGVIYTKGGANGTKIFGNYIHLSKAWSEAILLGGSSEAIYVKNPSGYEAYNSVAYNNIVRAESPGGIYNGIAIRGCDTCAAYNNVVIGAQNALVTYKGPGTSTGWTWDVLVRNPSFQNNIVLNSTHAATNFANIQGTLTNDHNLYYNSPQAPKEAHGVYADPMFVDNNRNWRLKTGSPAIGAGAVLNNFSGHNGESINLSNDRDGVKRTTPWDIGAYVASSSPSTPTPTATAAPTPTATATPTPTATATPTPTPVPVGNGNGLSASYFPNLTLSGVPAVQRVDSTVNFNWGLGSPDPALPADNFSVRWTGQVKAPASGTYTFCTQADDGVRLWVNNVQLVDNWVNQATTETCGSINLTQGQSYSLKMEYYEYYSTAVANLLWQGPSISKQAIPQSQLYQS
jgi:hypothetical protein